MATVVDQVAAKRRPIDVSLQDLERPQTQTETRTRTEPQTEPQTQNRSQRHAETHQPPAVLAAHPSLTSPIAPLPDAPFPERGTRANLVVLGSFAILTATFGLTSSLGIFQSYLAINQLSGYPPSLIAWIPGVNVFLTLLLGVQFGPLFDAYGPRWILLISSVAYVISLLLMAECREFWQYILVFGVLAGVCSAALTTIAIAVIAHWFEKRRGWANGIAFIGSSLGGVVFPLVLNPALEKLGWAWAIRIVALIALALLVLGNLCVRGRLEKGKKGGVIDLRCFRDERFVWATVGIAGFEFVLFGALGLLPTYVLSQGYDTQTSSNVIASLSAGSAVGRYTAGWFSDFWGRFNTMGLTLFFSLVVTFGLWLPIPAVPMDHSYPLLYIFATLFGFSSGSVISLAPVCFGQLCKAGDYGQYYGTSYSVVSFATLICIPIGGALMPSIGPMGFVAIFGGILSFSLLSFMMARWACLDYHWKWKAKI